MIVPIETRGIPEVTTDEAISARFAELVSGELPAFVIANAWSTNEQAVEALAPLVEQAGYRNMKGAVTHSNPAASRLPQRIALRVIKPTRRANPRGIIHADYQPEPSHEVKEVRIHTTEEGEVLARFYEPTQEYAEAYMSWKGLKKFWKVLDNPQVLAEFYLPGAVYKQIRDNIVDDAIVRPVVHTVRARAGDTILFRSGGARPLFHVFDATQVPRQSKVSGAVVKK